MSSPISRTNDSGDILSLITGTYEALDKRPKHGGSAKRLVRSLGPPKPQKKKESPVVRLLSRNPADIHALQPMTIRPGIGCHTLPKHHSAFKHKIHVQSRLAHGIYCIRLACQIVETPLSLCDVRREGKRA